jgi:hypothetical protein
MRVLLSLGTLCLLASLAPAEEALVPVSPNAVHFRLEVGLEPGHVVAGWLDVRGESGTEFDAAVLDLDADGEPETVQPFGMVKDYRTQKNVRHPKIAIERDGVKWELDLRYSGLVPSQPRLNTYIRWSATKGDLYAWFINGRVLFHATAEAAAKAKPVRLGPPFHFEVGTRQRGAQALARVGLKDANGCTMRLARQRTERGNVRELKIKVRLTQDGETRYETWASYG